MKKLIFFMILGCFFTFSSAFAGGVIAERSQASYSSIIYKDFTKDNFEETIETRWILIKTNPSFVPGQIDHLSLHSVVLTVFENNGWRAFYLSDPEDPDIFNDRSDAVFLNSNISVFKDRKVHGRKKTEKIVEYNFPFRPDVETVFDDRARLSFSVIMPEFGDSSMWNTFRYRDEGVEKFFQKTIAEKLEKKLKDNHRLK